MADFPKGHIQQGNEEQEQRSLLQAPHSQKEIIEQYGADNAQGSEEEDNGKLQQIKTLHILLFLGFIGRQQHFRNQKQGDGIQQHKGKCWQAPRFLRPKLVGDEPVLYVQEQYENNPKRVRPIKSYFFEMVQ